MLRLGVGMFCEILQCIGNCLDGSKETAGWYSLELHAHWINHQYDIIIYNHTITFLPRPRKPNDIVAFFPIHKALFVRFQDATSRKPSSPNHPPPWSQAAVLSSKFRNLHLWGCWWYCNKPPSWRSGLGEYVAGWVGNMLKMCWLFYVVSLCVL